MLANTSMCKITDNKTAQNQRTLSLAAPANARRALAQRDLGLQAVQQPGALGQGGGLHPVGHVELAQDIGHVHGGGRAADEQFRAIWALLRPAATSCSTASSRPGQPYGARASAGGGGTAGVWSGIRALPASTRTWASNGR